MHFRIHVINIDLDWIHIDRERKHRQADLGGAVSGLLATLTAVALAMVDGIWRMSAASDYEITAFETRCSATDKTRPAHCCPICHDLTGQAYP